MLTKQQMFGTKCMMFLDEAWEPDKPMVYPNGPHFCIWIDEPLDLDEGGKKNERYHLNGMSDCQNKFNASLIFFRVLQIITLRT